MSSILFEIKNAVAYITLNRPEKFNSFNREMALLMQAKLDEAASLHEVRAVCITGAGKAFCAGQDISELVGDNKVGIAQILSEHYNPIVKRIRNMPKPVIAAVNGVAAGAGANIALCCDVVLATASASFIQAFSKIGLIPDSGGTYTLPRLIGWQKASALIVELSFIFLIYPFTRFSKSQTRINPSSPPVAITLFLLSKAIVLIKP